MPKLGLGLSLPQTRVAGGFTPKKLSGLSLWLKADAGVSLDGPSVTAWADQSGNSVTAGIFDEFPIYNASDLNGKPTISLSSLEGNIRPFELLNANSVMGATGTTAFAVVYVEDVCNDVNDNGPIFGNFGSTIDDDPQSQGHYPYGPECSVYDSFCTTSRKNGLTAPVTITNAWSLYSVSSTNGDWRAYVNGLLMHSDASNTYNNTAYNSGLYIGYQDAGGAYTLKGKIAEAITYNRVLTTPERQQVEQYLNSKYQIYPWRIVISGAGTTTSNGEYVWDGVTVSLGKPLYMSGTNPLSWDGAKWYIGDEDGLGGDPSYSSGDLITWTIENGDSPTPSSTLYYTP